MISYVRSGVAAPVPMPLPAACRNLKASACRVSARSASPVSCKFSRRIFSTLPFISMKVAKEAPRLRASMPTPPTPPKRSRKRASSTRVERISKRAVLTLSMIGRVPIVFGDLSLRPFASPVTTRIAVLLKMRQQHLGLRHKVVLLAPGDQSLGLIAFQFLLRGRAPDTPNEGLQLFRAELPVNDIVQNFKTARADERGSTRLAQPAHNILDTPAMGRRQANAGPERCFLLLILLVLLKIEVFQF